MKELTRVSAWLCVFVGRVEERKREADERGAESGFCGDGSIGKAVLLLFVSPLSTESINASLFMMILAYMSL